MRALALSFAPLGASCHSLVQAVDEQGEPVVGATAMLQYPSITTACGTTDGDGYVWLPDAWFQQPLFSITSGHVALYTDELTAYVTWPAPSP